MSYLFANAEGSAAALSMSSAASPATGFNGSARSLLTAKTLLIIPCFNEERHIEALVERLLQQQVGDLLTIVIVDGASTDATAAIAQRLGVRHPEVHYLYNEARIQSAGMNLAVEQYGKGFDYLIRIDAHAEYPDNYCAVLVDEAQRQSADSVVVSMRTTGSETFFQRMAAAAQNSKLGNGGSAHRLQQGSGRWIEHGHHALIRTARFLSVGGYDGTFTHNEDAEFDIRMAKAGFRCWLTARTEMYYYPRSGAVPLFRQYFNYGKGRARTLLKHTQVPKVRQTLPLLVAPALALAFLSFITPLAALPLAIWGGACIAYGLLKGLKERDLPTALLGFAAMVIHFGWSLGFWVQMFRQLAAKGRK